ncbi:MAG TPA: NAD(P)H-hydrate dehydratase, partial [Acidimicrobiia bacterium]|nr:NAD(P)H-hydrate dehydratase [Acidimicrobiia bacterium]
LLVRDPQANKYDFGHVLIVGGSPGMVGAPFLAAMSALRVGAGLVTIASTKDVIDKLEERVVEVMTFRIPNDSIEAVKSLGDFISERRVSVVVVGPGMDNSGAQIAKSLLVKLDIPIIIDAGALTVFRGDLDVLKQVGLNNPNVIVTPHDGEFAKLTGNQMPSSGEERESAVAEFAQEFGMTLVAKGSPTLVAHVDGSVYINETGNPGLATAGSGDVLAGVIAGIVAQGADVSEAADLAVRIHGLAADLGAKEKTQPGLIASDLIEFIPQAMKLEFSDER